MAAEGPRSTKFVADAMLGSLARKLRAFGFDAVYRRGGSDTALLAACARQSRVLVTADRLLAARAARRGLPCLLVAGSSDRARLSEMVRASERLRLPLKRGAPRCSLCNGRLIRVTAAEARKKVPRPVAVRHRLFFRCASCGQTYWKGGHWKKLRRLLALIERKPQGSR